MLFPHLDIDHDVSALDSTAVSFGIKLFSRAAGKYSRGAVKIHTMTDLRGSIPSFILVTDGKYHGSNVLDAIRYMPDTIYPMDKACVDFEALFRLNQAGACFVTGAKTSIQYNAVELNGNMDETTGLRADKTIVIMGYRSKKLYPDNLRLVE